MQRHLTFDMLLHIEHWSLWWVTVTMYGRFHQQLLSVMRDKLNLSFIIDDREILWFSYYVRIIRTLFKWNVMVPYSIPLHV